MSKSCTNCNNSKKCFEDMAVVLVHKNGFDPSKDYCSNFEAKEECPLTPSEYRKAKAYFKQRIEESLDKANWQLAQGTQKVTDTITRDSIYKSFNWLLD